MGCIKKRYCILLFVITGVISTIAIYYGGFWIYSKKYKSKISKILKANTIKPIDSLKNKTLLNHSITDFYIKSSHNTYLDAMQHGSLSSTSNVEYALKAGARSIELDISDVLSVPVVAHGEDNFITTTYVPLSTMLDTIVKYGFNTSDPLFLCLEIYDKKNTKNIIQVRDLLIDKLGDRIYNYDNMQRSVYTDFTKVPVKDLLNKVIILATNCEELNQINHAWYAGSSFINIDNKDSRITEKPSGKLSRVYLVGSLDSYLSKNIDPVELWKQKHNMIAMNFQMNDKYLYKNMLFFKDYSLRYVNDPDVINFLKDE